MIQYLCKKGLRSKDTHTGIEVTIENAPSCNSERCVVEFKRGKQIKPHAEVSREAKGLSLHPILHPYFMYVSSETAHMRRHASVTLLVDAISAKISC